MTEDEAVEKLNGMGADWDIERAHVDADDVLLAVLRANGLARVADAYDALRDRLEGFWYA